MGAGSRAEKIKKIFQKTIDKTKIIWYNLIKIKKERGQ